MEWHQYTKHEEGEREQMQIQAERGKQAAAAAAAFLSVCVDICVCVCARVSRYKRKGGIGASCTFVRLSGDVGAGDGFGGSGFLFFFLSCHVAVAAHILSY